MKEIPSFDFKAIKTGELNARAVEKAILKYTREDASSIGIDFNVLSPSLSHEDLIGLYVAIFIVQGFINSDEALQGVLDYALTMRRGYTDTTYHCFHHAMDVTCMTLFLLRDMGIQEQASLDSVDVAALLLAALGHDVLHPGTNNLYQVHSKTPVAIKYHNESVLERCSLDHVKDTLTATSLLSLLTYPDVEPGTPFEDVESEIMRLISDAILKTDMMYHFKLLESLVSVTEYIESVATSRMGSLRQESDMYSLHSRIQAIDTAASTNSMESLPKVRIPDEFTHQLIINSILHAADISNPARPFVLCEKWSGLVVEEFFRQGELEAAAGLPITPNMDRATTDTIKGQISFSDFLVKPYFETLAELFPRTLQILDILVDNTRKWQEKADERDDLAQEEEDKVNAIAVTASPATFSAPSEEPLGPVIGHAIRAQSVSPSRDGSLRRPPARGMAAFDLQGGSRRMSLAAGTIELPENFEKLMNRHASTNRSRGNLSSAAVNLQLPGSSYTRSFSIKPAPKSLYGSAASLEIMNSNTPVVAPHAPHTRTSQQKIAPSRLYDGVSEGVEEEEEEEEEPTVYRVSTKKH